MYILLYNVLCVKKQTLFIILKYNYTILLITIWKQCVGMRRSSIYFSIQVKKLLLRMRSVAVARLINENIKDTKGTEGSYFLFELNLTIFLPTLQGFEITEFRIFIYNPEKKSLYTIRSNYYIQKTQRYDLWNFQI